MSNYVQELLDRVAYQLQIQGKTKAEFLRELNIFKKVTPGRKVTVYRWFSGKTEPRAKQILAIQEWLKNQ